MKKDYSTQPWNWLKNMSLIAHNLGTCINDLIEVGDFNFRRRVVLWFSFLAEVLDPIPQQSKTSTTQKVSVLLHELADDEDNATLMGENETADPWHNNFKSYWDDTQLTCLCPATILGNYPIYLFNCLSLCGSISLGVASHLYQHSSFDDEHNVTTSLLYAR